MRALSRSLMTTSDFDYIRNFVREQSAIVIEPGKEYLVHSRLQALRRKENFTSTESFVGKLRSDPNKGYHGKVVEAMTTNETSFFRDIHPFEALRKVLLPQFMASRAKERQLNIWCGAASTGQEPYSVLMLIAQNFPELLSWDIKFIATDLSREVLARARAGRYSQLEVNRGLPAAFLVKYFARQGIEWQIQDDLRRRVDFREMNLVKEWPLMPPLDFVFLRNDMIYFDIHTKKAILAKIRRLLRPGGYLLLGGAETTFNVDDGFERVVVDKATCYQLKPA